MEMRKHVRLKILAIIKISNRFVFSLGLGKFGSIFFFKCQNCKAFAKTMEGIPASDVVT